MIGTTVYIKFGEHHGKKAKVVAEAQKGDMPYFYLLLDDDTLILKKQKNTIKVIDR